MKDFMNSFQFIIAFLVFCILINMLFGEKAATRFVQLILFSMVMVNADTIIAKIESLGLFD